MSGKDKDKDLSTRLKDVETALGRVQVEIKKHHASIVDIEKYKCD